MDLLETNEIPCLLCGKHLRQRTDKRGKPYFVCDPCGIQLFVRRKRGIELLEILKSNLSDIRVAEGIPGNLIRIRQLIAEIEGTREQRERIESSINWLFPNNDLIQMGQILKNREKQLLKDLETVSVKPESSR